MKSNKKLYKAKNNKQKTLKNLIPTKKNQIKKSKNKNKKTNPESTKNTSKQHQWPFGKPNISIDKENHITQMFWYNPMMNP